MTATLDNLCALDRELSNRHLDLDPVGYFIIYVDRDAGLICAKHYSNIIDDRGLAINPETGEVIPARGNVQRSATQLYTGKTAKELCVKLLERSNPVPVSMLNHAAYLGREFVRAEIALLDGSEYIQD
jgi:dihydropteroate synthase